MSTANRFRCIGIGVLVIASADLAVGQAQLHRTLVVDKSNNYDHTSIQSAISDNRIGNDPTDRWTILIYAGTYTEAVTLGDTKENVDLVGVDRDAVIIKPPADTDGITIQGDGARNNSIRNLTIMTHDDTGSQGRGIVIKQQTTDGNPSQITIANVTIQCDGTQSTAISVVDAAEDIVIDNVLIKTTAHTGPGIDGATTTGLRVTNSTLLLFDGDGVKAGDDCRISNCLIVVDKSFGTQGTDADDTAGVYADGCSGLRITSSKLKGREDGIRLLGNCTDVVVSDCELVGSHYGAYVVCGDAVLFQGCTIVGDSRNGRLYMIPAPEYHGVYIKDGAQCDPGVIRLVGCSIQAYSARSDANAEGVTVTAAPASSDGPVQIIDCTINSEVTSVGDKSFGVVADEANAVALVGGSISSVDGDERQTDQYDLLNNAASGLGIRVSGTRLSKWKGTVGPASRAKSVVQRTIDVDAPSAAAILYSTPLTDVEQPNVTPDNQPDVYRVLSVRGNLGGMNQVVYIIGTDWGGNDITDKITLNGTSTVDGVKPFKTVDHIILPAKTAPLQAVSVGTTSKLGLYYPISAASDVIQEARLVSGVYTDQATGTVDATYSTVIPSTINDGDSFEWSVLASE